MHSIHPQVQFAKMFAKGAHIGQTHSGRPFWCHLEDVANTLDSYNLATGELLCAAWLHDTIEDTPTTYQDLKQLFGEEIAELVWAVTDEMGRNRKERKEKSHAKNFATRESTILKLADLYVNVKASINYETGHLKMYAKEWEGLMATFKEAVKTKAPEALSLLTDINELMISSGY
ncbi:MAG: HD domain-containing protein [Candidatus Thorarchaeota archaeon]